MSTIPHGPSELVDPVQLRYASIVVWYVRFALIALYLSFIVYATGFAPSALAVSEVPELWHLSARAYAETTTRPLGWGWLSSISEGRLLAFGALVLFPSGSVLMMAATSWLYLRHRSLAHATIAFLEFAVLFAGASGVLSGA